MISFILGLVFGIIGITSRIALDNTTYSAFVLDSAMMVYNLEHNTIGHLRNEITYPVLDLTVFTSNDTPDLCQLPEKFASA